MTQGLKHFKLKLFDKDKRKYEEFAIDIADEGKKVTYTCNQDKLVNSLACSSNQIRKTIVKH